MVVSLYLDARATTGEAPVKVSISDKSRKVLIPMGVKVLPSQWDAENRVVKNHPNKKEINSFLSGRKSDIEVELLRLERLGKLKGASLNNRIVLPPWLLACSVGAPPGRLLMHNTKID